MKTNYESLHTIMLVVWSILMLAAISLTSASLSKSIKWNLYDSQNDFGFGTMFKIYAYQNLWTAYDHYDEFYRTEANLNYIQAYELLNISGKWRYKPRTLVLVSTCLSAISLLSGILFGVIYFMKKKVMPFNVARIFSSVLCLVSGSLLIYALVYYKSKYKVLLAPAFHDPTGAYPDEDKLSTGFYLASAASALLFLSAVLNILCIIFHIKKPNVRVNQMDI